MKNIKVEFTEKNLTGNAGRIHFGRFMKKLGDIEKLISFYHKYQNGKEYKFTRSPYAETIL